MLIRGAEIRAGEACVDLRIEGDLITQIDHALSAREHERVIDAQGGALLPGLHDHHLHLYATAAAMQSVACGPPRIHDAAQLAQALAEAQPGEDGWIRGTGYHESVAGELNRAQLDAWVPAQPVRIQHRSGRLWIFNSRAIEALEVDSEDPLERVDGLPTGRLFDADGWLRTRLDGRRPNLQPLSTRMLRWGITGCTDTGHANDAATVAGLVTAIERGELHQRLRVMGGAALDALQDAWAQCGEHKFHLHDHALPDFEAICESVRRSHANARAAAFHCVTRGELVFALAVLRAVGASGRDRIEHGGIVPPELIPDLRELGVRVVTQPHFIAERGDAYIRDVEHPEQVNLYRLRSLLDAGVPLAAGSDAPYGAVNPWAAMQAAVERRTAEGRSLGAIEALSPEQALALFLAPLEDCGAPPRRIAVGTAADLCLLSSPWNDVRRALEAVEPRLVLVRGVAAADRSHPL